MGNLKYSKPPSWTSFPDSCAHPHAQSTTKLRIHFTRETSHEQCPVAFLSLPSCHDSTGSGGILENWDFFVIQKHVYGIFTRARNNEENQMRRHAITLSSYEYPRSAILPFSGAGILRNKKLGWIKVCFLSKFMTSTGPNMKKALFWEGNTETMCLQESQIFHGWGDLNSRVLECGLITHSAWGRSATPENTNWYFITNIGSTSTGANSSYYYMNGM